MLKHTILCENEKEVGRRKMYYKFIVIHLILSSESLIFSSMISLLKNTGSSFNCNLIHKSILDATDINSVKYYKPIVVANTNLN